MTPNPDSSYPAAVLKKRVGQGYKTYGRRGLISAFLICIGLALMMNGAVAAPYRQIAFLLFGLPLLAMLPLKLTKPAARSLWRWTVMCMALFLIWALIQSTALPFGWLAHPVWAMLNEMGIPAQSTLSVAPSTTRAAIPALILPFLIFGAMLLLCRERHEALFAWKGLAVLGLVLTGLSILLETLYPQIMFFSRFEVGRGSFNGILVNRNTTAAFIGLSAFATAGWLMLPRPRRRREWPARTGLAAFGWSRVALAGLLFLLVITLITTRSRAGVTLAILCLTLAFATILLLLQVTDTTRQKHSLRRLGLGAKLVLVFVAGGALFIAFGEPVISRMGAEAEDLRWCAYAATLQIFAERPVVGLGFGTFEDAFPQYRDLNCLGTRGRWTRAHNSYLELLAGMGVIGGLVLVTGLTVLVRVLIIGIRTRKSLRAIPILTLGALTFVALHSIVDFPLQVPGVALYFAALLGAGCAVSILERHVDHGRSQRSVR